MAMPALPSNWQETRIGDHLDSPFSDAAFAAPIKGYIELGQIDTLACAEGLELPEKHYVPDGWVLKEENEEPDLPPNKPAAMLAAHQLLLDATYEILGPDRFAKAEILFGDRYGPVAKGASQVTLKPHIDILPDRFDYEYNTRLVAFACNVVPPIIYQGGYRRSEVVERGHLGSLYGLNRRFIKTTLPLNTLVLMSVTLMHESGRAEQAEPARYFPRWHIKF